MIPKTRQKESEEDRRDVFAQYHSNSLNTGTFMLLSGRWKYIAYVGYPSQLFNLQDDPDEINDLSGTMPEMVEQMENKLKNYVDKEEIDRKVKQYDLESFCNWKGSIDKEEYEMIMKNEFAFWDQNQSEILESWIERSHKHTFN